MKIVICGGGLVGSAIASHLCEEQNDVTVIDDSAENIQRITAAIEDGTLAQSPVMAECLWLRKSHPKSLKQGG